MPNYSSDHVFHALSDPTRRAIIEQLGRGPASVSALAKMHKMALPSFMQHLQVLEASGLVRSKKVGRVRICECIREPLLQAELWLSQQRKLWEQRLDQLDNFLKE